MQGMNIFMLNKPAGVVSATEDKKKERTVIDLIKRKQKKRLISRGAA